MDLYISEEPDPYAYDADAQRAYGLLQYLARWCFLLHLETPNEDYSLYPEYYYIGRRCQRSLPPVVIWVRFIENDVMVSVKVLLENPVQEEVHNFILGIYTCAGSMIKSISVFYFTEGLVADSFYTISVQPRYST